MEYAIAAIAVVLTVLAWKINKKVLSCYYILACLWTEFYYINICGGKVRIYHFIAITIILLEIMKAISLLKHKRFWPIWIFVIWAVVISVFAVHPLSAFISVISLALNCAVGVAALVILYNKWISVKDIQQVTTIGLIICCIIGIIQFFMQVLFNINIGASAEQVTQIAIGMIPALNTEANVFGRVMMVYMLFMLPTLISQSKEIRGIWCMYILSIFCTLINATRSVLYPGIVAIVLCLFIAIYKKQFLNAVKTYAKLAVVAGIIIGLLLLQIIPAYPYTYYKLQSMMGGSTIDTSRMLSEAKYDTIDSQKDDNYVSMDELNANKANAINSNKEDSSSSAEKDKETGELIEKEEESGKLIEKEEESGKFENKGYDESATYRVGMIKMSVQSVVSNPKTVLVGKGWGQVFVTINNTVVTQTGGSDWVCAFVYTGVIGLILYCIMTFSIFVALIIEGVLKKRENTSLSLQLLGALGACFIIGVSGLLSANIIMPYYWLIVCISVFLVEQAKECEK